MKNPIAERPWLLVILAFLVLIGVWVTVIQLSGRIETRQLTPAEEVEILKRRDSRQDGSGRFRQEVAS